MRTLSVLFLALLLPSSFAYANAVPDAELSDFRFPVQVLSVDYDPVNNLSQIRGRAFNYSGMEQNDVVIDITFWDGDRAVATAVANLGHMFNGTYVYFKVLARGIDLSLSNVYTAQVRVADSDAIIHDQPPLECFICAQPAPERSFRERFPIEKMTITAENSRNGVKIDGTL